jgi:hypothetical protein
MGLPQGERLFIVAVTSAVIAVLMGLLSDRLEREVTKAQQMRAEFRLREIEAVVRLRESTLRVRGDMQRALEFDGANPMRWLQTDELGMKTELPDYLGEWPLEQAQNAHGKWVFDPGRRILAHLPVTAGAEYGPKDWQRYRLTVTRTERGAVTGLVLQRSM